MPLTDHAAEPVAATAPREWPDEAVIDGEIYRGAGGEHPEIGHIVVADDGPDCFCGRRGCLESLASGTAIGAMGRESSIGDSRAVFAAAAEGDPEARRIVGRATSAMANAALEMTSRKLLTPRNARLSAKS